MIERKHFRLNRKVMECAGQAMLPLLYPCDMFRTWCPLPDRVRRVPPDGPADYVLHNDALRRPYEAYAGELRPNDPVRISYVHMQSYRYDVDPDPSGPDEERWMRYESYCYRYAWDEATRTVLTDYGYVSERDRNDEPSVLRSDRPRPQGSRRRSERSGNNMQSLADAPYAGWRNYADVYDPAYQQETLRRMRIAARQLAETHAIGAAYFRGIPMEYVQQLDDVPPPTAGDRVADNPPR